MRFNVNWRSWADFLFAYQPERKPKWLRWAIIAVLFLGGMALWGVYLNWGRGPFNFHDWADITVPRLIYFQDVLENRVLPLHISDASPLNSSIDRFMAVPDVILSPQILLLSSLSTGNFILVNTWLLYAAGFGGLLWLRKRFRLSLTAFTIFFLLFNFNGHILAHFTVGHFTWVTYFLYPWFIGLVFDVQERGAGWSWTAKTAAWMFLVFINGGYHIYVWALFFLGFLLLVNIKNFWGIVRTAVVSVLLCAVRIFPLFLPLDEFDNIFIGGYPLSASIWSSLVDIQIPNDITLNMGMTRAVGLWEFTLYVGLLGAFFLLFFGVYRVITNPSKANSHPELLLPSIGLVILSLSKVYQYLRIALPIPIIAGERVSSRIIILAFLFILTLAVIELQRFLEQEGLPALVKFLVPLFAVILSNDLWQNFRFWRLRDAAEAFEAQVITPGKYFVTNYPDPEYFTMLWIGLAVSLLTLGLLIYFTRKENKKTRPAPAGSGEDE